MQFIKKKKNNIKVCFGIFKLMIFTELIESYNFTVFRG